MSVQLRRIRLSFSATGESAVAHLLDDEAPAVCQQIWDWLPIERKAIHGQFSGAEVFVLLEQPKRLPAEQLVQLPLPGEILYFFDPGTSVGGGTQASAEICVVYDRGVTLRGPEGVSVHGQPVCQNTWRLEARLDCIRQSLSPGTLGRATSTVYRARYVGQAF